MVALAWCKRLCAGLAVCALLAACTSPPPRPLRIASNVWPGYEPLYLARRMGLLEPLRVRLVELGSATEVMDALTMGMVEGGMLTLDEAVRVAAAGTPLSIVLVFDVSAGADAVVARTKIAGVEDLKGKRIAVEDTALGAWHLALFLRRFGLGPKDVHIVHAEIDRQPELWRKKRADVFITFEPVKSRLVAMGGKVVFDSRQIPGKIVDVLVVRREVAQREQARLLALRKAWLAALEEMHTHPEASARKMRYRLGLPAFKVQKAFLGLRLGDAEVNRRLLGGHPPPILRTAREIAQVLHKQGLLAGTLSPHALDALAWSAP